MVKIYQKRGWIRIIEAFVAILFLVGVVLVVINDGRTEEIGDGVSLYVHDLEISILREIQLNETLRNDILNANSVPLDSEDSEFPSSINNKIESKIPSSLECVSKICETDDDCVLTNPGTSAQKDVYAESVIISTTTGSSSYQPRQLKIFCWEK